MSSWEIASLEGMSLKREAMIGSQDLGKELITIVLKFLSEIAMPKAFARAHLFLNIAMNVGKSSLSKYVVVHRSCFVFCCAMSDATS